MNWSLAVDIQQTQFNQMTEWAIVVATHESYQEPSFSGVAKWKGQ